MLELIAWCIAGVVSALAAIIGAVEVIACLKARRAMVEMVAGETAVCEPSYNDHGG